MFFRFILRALEYRKQRLALAFSALAVAATLATVLFGIYSTSGERIRDEFRSYGANLVAAPASGNTVPLGITDEAAKLGAEVVPFLVTSARAGNEVVAVVGFEPGPVATRMTSYWHVNGTRDIHSGECLAGELIAGRLGLQLGQTVSWAQPPCTLKGIIATGGVEDQELLVSGEFPRDSESFASFIQLRVPGDRIEAIRSTLAAQFPGVDFRTVRSIAETESNVVLKVRAALLLLTLVILVITTLCVSSNFTEMVIERSKEIGILKALGAAERKIAAFFVSESAALALGATITGYIAGVFAAAAIGRQIFGGAFHLQPNLLVFLSVAAVMLAVAALATAIATSRIRGIQPAIILRGE
ncbi:MAG: putative transport system permease protein [Bryobacterales bacterium]|jgi:putative ABC transport system permease protein|nr:putative transport system permease protein [Bryobacterales bacterium]